MMCFAAAVLVAAAVACSTGGCRGQALLAESHPHATHLLAVGVVNVPAHVWSNNGTTVHEIPGATVVSTEHKAITQALAGPDWTCVYTVHALHTHHTAA